MQRNTQHLLLVGVIAAGILLGRVFLQHDLQPSEKTPDNNSSVDSSPVSNTSLTSTPPPLTEQATPQAHEQNESGPVNLWSVGSNLDIDIPAAQSDIDGAVILEYDTRRLRSLQRGDALLIDIPQQNNSYQLNIEKVVNHPGGIKVIQARQSDNVRLILTLGQKNTFANLATLEGNFELVGNASAGWLMPAENMDPNLDPSIPDYVVSSKAQARLQNLEPRQKLN